MNCISRQKFLQIQRNIPIPPRGNLQNFWFSQIKKLNTLWIFIFTNQGDFFDRRYDEPLFIFIWGLLEWPFIELFLPDASLWNQYKSIVFNIFSCIILIIYCKILIITVKSNVATNELTVYAKLHWNVIKFYQFFE